MTREHVSFGVNSSSQIEGAHKDDEADDGGSMTRAAVFVAVYRSRPQRSSKELVSRRNALASFFARRTGDRPTDQHRVPNPCTGSNALASMKTSVTRQVIDCKKIPAVRGKWHAFKFL